MPNFIQLYTLAPIVFIDGYEAENQTKFETFEEARTYYNSITGTVPNRIGLYNTVINGTTAGTITVVSSHDTNPNQTETILNTDFGQVTINYLERDFLDDENKITILTDHIESDLVTINNI
jgi:hypothetical protein